ncbi:hypothetical protein Nepgr_021323 [Nepenthes gracilis]|uniref:Gnk2-homologous domain-containing protein n=1 Tax=Nepenthes gracilis TaxID=150966 RepID=A0AAD3XVU7_NEPGR|nr:hypothetical protein Nepgr_021323 [Nepenthes gracilis]
MADLHNFLLIVVFSFQFSITSAQELTVKVNCSNESVHSQSYFDNLLRELSNADEAFDKSVEEESPYQVHGLYLFRGNATDQIFRRCVHNATSKTANLCPYTVGAKIVYDYCMSEDSNVSSLDILEYFKEIYMWNVKNITGTSVGSFDQVVTDTLSDIALEAAKGDRLGQKFATKEANYAADNRTLYALGQCTPDLSSLDCYTCLTDCIEQLPSCCSGKLGGRVQFLSCNIRYEIYSFYGNAPANRLPPPNGKSISQWHRNVYHFLTIRLSRKL